MTISSSTNKHIYSGNGLTRNWTYTFPIIDPTDIQVFLTDPDGVSTELTANFEVDTINNYVVYPTLISGLPLLPALWKITLLRTIPLTQEIDLVTQGPLPADTLEDGYDKLTMITQQLNESLSRCVKFPVSENPTQEQTESYLTDITISTAAAAAYAAASSASASASSASAAAALASENAAELAEANITQTIQDFVDGFVDRIEIPANLVNGINKEFNATLLPVNAVVKVFRDGLLVDPTEYSFAVPIITFVTAPAIGQKIVISYITNGLTANPVTPPGSWIPEYREITAGEFAAKQLTLLNTPSVAAQVIVDLIGGSGQTYGGDFDVAGNVVNWNGLGLESVIVVGSILRIEYYY